MRKFIGWDCANKTLAWSYISVDTEILVKISTLIREMHRVINVYESWDSLTGATPQDRNNTFISSMQGLQHAMLTTIQGFIIYHSYGVTDVLKGRKLADVSPVERTKALWSFLSTHPTIGHVAPDTTSIIEYQPPKVGSAMSAKTNVAASAVSHQLMFYYVNYNPILVDPKLKNTIACSSTMTYESYLAAEMIKRKSPREARYAARKIHSKENFIYLCTMLGLQHIIKSVKASQLDDLADSTMQVVAHLVSTGAIVRPSI